MLYEPVKEMLCILQLLWYAAVVMAITTTVILLTVTTLKRVIRVKMEVIIILCYLLLLRLLLHFMAWQVFHVSLTMSCVHPSLYLLLRCLEKVTQATILLHNEERMVHLFLVLLLVAL